MIMSDGPVNGLPANVIQNRSASTDLLSPCEWPVHVRYGEDHSMNLNNVNVQ